MQNEKRVANIYTQPQPVFASTIIASSAGLDALKKAISDAEIYGEGKCILYTSDMIQYELLIIRNDESVNELFWRKLEPPYTEYQLPDAE